METIKKNREFRKVYSKGKSIADPYLVLYKMHTGAPLSRIGISISAKVGNSVTRNKIKRQIKEILRINYGALLGGYDIIFIVRVRCKYADFSQIKRSVFTLLQKADLLEPNFKELI